MFSKLKLSILVNLIGPATPEPASSCVEGQACTYLFSPRLSQTTISDTQYADAIMTQIIYTSHIQTQGSCCADTTGWFTTPATLPSKFYEDNDSTISKSKKFVFNAQWDQAPYDPILVVLTHINEASGKIYGSEHFLLVYKPDEDFYSASDLQDIKSQRITAFCQTMKDGWILHSDPSISLVGTFIYGVTTTQMNQLNGLQSDEVVVGALALCPYVLKMSSPESLTIGTSSDNAFQFVLGENHGFQVSGSVPYTLANGQLYSGDVTFDLCSGDDGTCVPIFTLSYLNCMGIAISIPDSDQSMTVKFPTFNQFFQWNEFFFSEQTASCEVKVNAYILKLTDPNEALSEVKIERPDNFSDFVIVEANWLGYGQYFTLDPNLLKISFNSDSFIDPSKYIYMGSYKIEVWGGQSKDQIQSQQKLTYTLEISSECLDAVNMATITNNPLGLLEEKCAGQNSEFSIDLSLKGYPKQFQINEDAVKHDEDMCGTIQYSIESPDDTSVQLITENANKRLIWPSSLTNPFYKRVSSVTVKAEQVGYSLDTYSFTFTQIVCSIRFEHEDYSGQESDFIFPLNALNTKIFSVNKDPLTPTECEDDDRAKIYLNEPGSETSNQEIDNISFASKYNDTSFTVDVSGFSFDELKELEGYYSGSFAREETWGCEVKAETDFNFNLYMCWITEPSPIFVDTSVIQYEIDISDSFEDSLSVQINPFTTNFIQCGGLQYGLAAKNEAWDAFQEGLATFDQTDTFNFTNIRSYPTGNLTVTLKAWLDCVDDIYTATPVEIQFVIQVVDNSPPTSEFTFVSESSTEQEAIEEEQCGIATSSKTEIQTLQYELFSGLTEIIGIQKVSLDCENTLFEVRMTSHKKVPSFLKIQELESNFTVTVDTNRESSIGIYEMQFVELDTLTKQEAITVITLNVTQQDNSLFAFLLKLQSRKSTKAEGVEIIPLVAQLYELSSTGNLTIFFNKPIIIPPMQIYDLNQNETARLLSSKNDKLIQIEDVLRISLESSFYDNDSEELRIEDYKLTRLTQYAMDIQISFQQPKVLATSPSDPEKLILEFYNGKIFMDENDFDQLDLLFELDISITPQRTKEEEAELVTFAESIESSMDAFSIGNLILSLTLAFGLKYLWKMVNLLQFVVYMRIWLTNVPVKADIFIDSLRSMAFFEFLPQEEIGNAIMDWLGIETDCKKTDSCKNSIFAQFSVVIIAAVLILLVIVILILFFVLKKISPKVESCYVKLKNSLFYGTFIRYILLSTLKIQMTLCVGIAIGKVIEPTVKNPIKEQSYVKTAFAVVVLLNLTPVLFGSILWKNREKLDDKEVQRKFGALYDHFNPKKPYVGSYYLLFIVRRGVFVLITFVLYERPGIQILSMCLLTLMHLCYISNMKFYMTPSQKKIEMVNEFLLAILCYHFVAFADNQFTLSPKLVENLGTSTIIFVLILLGMNTLIILVVNYQAIRFMIIKKCYKKRVRKQMKKVILLAMDKMVNLKAQRAYKVEENDVAEQEKSDSKKSDSDSKSSDNDSKRSVKDSKSSVKNSKRSDSYLESSVNDSKRSVKDSKRSDSYLESSVNNSKSSFKNSNRSDSYLESSVNDSELITSVDQHNDLFVQRSLNRQKLLRQVPLKLSNKKQSTNTDDVGNINNFENNKSIIISAKTKSNSHFSPWNSRTPMIEDVHQKKVVPVGDDDANFDKVDSFKEQLNRDIPSKASQQQSFSAAVKTYEKSGTELIRETIAAQETDYKSAFQIKDNLTDFNHLPVAKQTIEIEFNDQMRQMRDNILTLDEEVAQILGLSDPNFKVADLQK